MRKWNFYVDTYGCKVNQYESQAIAEAWTARGGERCNDPAHADYIIINSCAITAKAERDARNAIYRFKRLAPQAKIILTGCAAQFFSEFKPRKKAIWNAPDYCIAQKSKNCLLLGPENLESNLLSITGAPGFGITSYYRGRPVIKIQDGCSQNCTYCIVPQTRGKPRSVPPVKILAEMRHLLECGYPELVISGVNLRQYGIDNAAYGDFWDLISFLDRELQYFAGKARYRVSSLEPAQLTARGIDTLLNLKLACPHLHLSLQHAAPEILRKMGRGHYKCADVLAAIKKIKSEWKTFGLGADIIAGFPGESEEDIKYLLNFIDEMPFTYAHVFPYSARQGSAAKNFPGHIAQNEKKQRAAVIREKIARKKMEFCKSLLNIPEMSIAPDLAKDNGKNGNVRGVNEYYTTCHFSLSTPKTSSLGLIHVKPLGLLGDGLLVQSTSNLP